jgi:hypothetical protein
MLIKFSADYFIDVYYLIKQKLSKKVSKDGLLMKNGGLLNGFCHLIRSYASSAEIFFHIPAILHNLDLLNVRFPYFLGLSVRMAHAMPELNCFSANFTLCHTALQRY